MTPGRTPGLPMLQPHGLAMGEGERRRLLREAVEDIDQLGQAPRALLFPLFDAVGHALLDVKLEHGQADTVEGGLGSGELLQDLDAQAWLLDHAADSPNLAFDAV